MDNFIYALFVAVALILMVWMSGWAVRRDRKYYGQYRNGRIERWRI